MSCHCSTFIILPAGALHELFGYILKVPVTISPQHKHLGKTWNLLRLGTTIQKSTGFRVQLEPRKSRSEFQRT